jgi:alpha-L-fucosidase
MKTIGLFHTSCLAALILLSFASRLALADPGATSVDPHASETAAHRDHRMAWWRAARFGMFIHWGLYSHYAGSFDSKPTNGYGEWIMHDEKIPVAAYADGASDFDPVNFHADTWVSIAKAAGMKYIVMTAKHHEGFAMYHSSVDGFNIYDATPFKRDPIAEMAAACKKQGLKFGVYYSQAQDWHHPGGGAYGGHWDPTQDGSMETYVKTIAAPQVRELLTKYKPAILWWDTPLDMTADDIRALTAAFPEDPGLIANNRLGNGVPGDTATPEQYVPATGIKGDWETCMTINNTWGYKAQDTDFKSTATLLHNLVDIASKGGNYLLNVGPDGTGIILEQIGRWLDANGSSIYGTKASPLAHLPANERMTMNGNTLYLHVFDWGGADATVPGLLTDIASAVTLVGHEKLNIAKTPDGVTTISVPSHPDPLDTVIVLKLKGPLSVSNAPTKIYPLADGSIVAKADTADLSGGLQVENGPDYDIGYWTDSSDSAKWTVVVPAGPGIYTVSIDYSCDNDSSGSTFDIAASPGSKVGGMVVGTGSGTWANYKTVQLGNLHIAPGVQTITVQATSKPGLAVMNLQSIILTPAPSAGQN